jgi:hypothetical protein
LLDQVQNGNECEVILTAAEKKLEQNSSYLTQRYPEETEVNQVLEVIQGMKPNRIKPEDLMKTIQLKQGTSLSRMKMLSILEILADSGLCQINKQGSIMEIKHHSEFRPDFDIGKSAAYREGINEKAAWKEFAQTLNIS